MSNKTGGAAFPRPAYSGQTKDGTAQSGMTLRDYFAGQCNVLAYFPYETLLKKLERSPTEDELADFIARIRLSEADAMLAAREVQS